MAYLKELRVPCNYRLCSEQSVVGIYDNRNSNAGVYCRKHGKELLERLKREKL